MNYSTAVFLINRHVRAMNVTYEDADSAKRTVFKTLDPDIDEDDLVIVETDTRHGFTVCKVVESDIDLDFDTFETIRWIVGRLDVTGHTQTLVQEKEAIKAIKSAELRQKREKLRNAMFADHVETLKALPIAAINGDEPEAAPEPEED
ncbi:MAG: hypothetical protein GY807_24060 [Gammaproteobacteria bacterium]|nr:hypothetical protein [Gammaproteobacteria bacterium]